MEQQLRQSERRVVGVRQVLRAVRDGKASQVFLCKDADEFLYRQVQSLCEERRVPVKVLDSMRELGKLCLVGVDTAAAALLKQPG
ncbi:MAG: ribosomal L7Ae/L30e/S12e/Gadd45 family protein [Candidatus Limiplasma sp.]|nr:ribosomal L7Ae/L30e/S12e/Gadd45 family protein [Candidatus Limiplasma sp.]